MIGRFDVLGQAWVSRARIHDYAVRISSIIIKMMTRAKRRRLEYVYARLYVFVVEETRWMKKGIMIIARRDRRVAWLLRFSLA